MVYSTKKEDEDRMRAVYDECKEQGYVSLLYIAISSLPTLD